MGRILIDLEKLDDLRHKANEGTLTREERQEYETLIETMDFFAFSQRMHLSTSDRDAFLKMLDSPPEPNEVLRRAAERYRERCG